MPREGDLEEARYQNQRVKKMKTSELTKELEIILSEIPPGPVRTRAFFVLFELQFRASK